MLPQPPLSISVPLPLLFPSLHSLFIPTLPLAPWDSQAVHDLEPLVLNSGFSAVA